MSNPISSKSDLQWQQESDAHTLAEAEKIKADSKRMKGASTAAKKMATDHQKTADSLKKVASKVVSNPEPSKSPSQLQRKPCSGKKK